jgi:RecA/RadA recombinase
MNKLLDKLMKAGTIKSADVLSDTPFFNMKDCVPTELPILNIAFSGDIDGGLVPGLSIIAGESRSYKTLLSLYCMKAYFNKYPDSIALLYDSEFGITPEYLEMNGIDASRIIHIPIEHIEQLKFDIVKRLEQIERGDKVFFMIDSIGSLPSKKEIDDALEESSAADMTRAKAIRSLLRIITPHLTMKDIPCLAINHIYKTMEKFSKSIISGGQSVMLCANQAFIVTRAQEKDGTDLVGYNFTINIEKSRFVKEKSKLTFQVKFDEGISKYSGLMDLALESGHVIKPKQGWYQIPGDEKNYRFANTNTPEFWDRIVSDNSFKEFITYKFKLTSKLLELEEDEPTEEMIEGEV